MRLAQSRFAVALVALTPAAGCDRASAPASTRADAGSAAKSAPHSASPSAGARSRSLPNASASAAPADLIPPEPHDEASEQACAALAGVVLPAADRAPESALLALRGCDTEALYYGIGAPADFVKARHCAYLEYDALGTASEILMMIYANGKGVPQNLERARKLACEFGGAPAEIGGRLWRLERPGRIQAGKDFDYCDDATSGMMMGVCAALDERKDAPKRAARKAAAVAGFPKGPLAKLDRAAKAFFDARENNEVDQSGTMRGAFSVSERSALEDRYVAALERLADPAFVPDAGDPKAAELELERVFAKLMKCESYTELARSLPGLVQAKGIRLTQQRWRVYRAAWVELALLARPGSRRELWAAWLARERLQALTELEKGC